MVHIYNNSVGFSNVAGLHHASVHTHGQNLGYSHAHGNTYSNGANYGSIYTGAGFPGPNTTHGAYSGYGYGPRRGSSKYRQNMSKKKCFEFFETGKCRYGDQCVFLHIKDDKNKKAGKS